jgi:hypothetical protein
VSQIDVRPAEVNFDRLPGRIPGLWLSVSALILAVPFPFAAFVLGVVGFGFSVRAFKGIPAGHHARHVTVAAIVMAAVAVVGVVATDLVTFLT